MINEEYDRLLKEQREVMNNLSKSDISHVDGYFNLTEEQRNLFLTVYREHLSVMGTIMRQNFMPQKIKKVKYDDTEKTVNVYFESDWFHYANDKTWY